MLDYPQLDGELICDEKGSWFYNNKRILFNRVRDCKKIEDENGQQKILKCHPIGIVVALDKDHIGFAQWHSKLDQGKWSAEYGLRVAIRRAIKGKNYLNLTKTIEKEYNGSNFLEEIPVVPHKIRPAYEKIQEMAAKFDFRIKQ